MHVCYNLEVFELAENLKVVLFSKLTKESCWK